MSFSKAWDGAKPVKANELKKPIKDSKKKKQSSFLETDNSYIKEEGK